MYSVLIKGDVLFPYGGVPLLLKSVIDLIQCHASVLLKWLELEMGLAQKRPSDAILICRGVAP